ncbi:ABC1 kinase family protein [Mycolicibacterium neworleansense]|uniref:Putative ABC transporter ATP-binding protein n=1 Tax=Mycolicibacterium neworleansense TaxID=146018 RepID=A0A0H5RT84_9MYCO|nr:AarF/ABC1/UbiB kinase family protein [Mycolicibacterium neworleansense]MCV7360031.1 AarF/ABC1/UbiB kinase family protein [Mycolicibacterium neworleansense]CRZ17365.1 putative ABC transporter ATP-binding protein [Mycolicibacterium neworleansense]
MTAADDMVPRGRFRRTMPLAGFTARAAGGRLVAGLREKSGSHGAVERFHERTAERYTELLGHSKGALMKAGQILSMVDAEAIGSSGFAPYQRALARLRTDAPPMCPDLVRTVLADELGSGTECFAEFDDEPIAAASVGQVHRAVLRDGRAVAVKIQYPGVAQAIRDDLANTELLLTFMRLGAAALGVMTDIRAMAAEITARIGEEVDYRHEAAMITAFADLLRGHPFIHIPDVIAEASGERVLTMTYLDGMDWAAAQHAEQDLRNTWAEAVFRFINSGSRHGNLVQVDPHPGNFLFNPDGTVGCLDFGCVQSFAERPRWLFLALMHAGMEGRYDDCRELMLQMGLISADSSLSDDDLRRVVSDMTHATTQPQPVTYTPELMARSLRAFLGDQNSAHMTVTREFVFLPRLQIAFDHIATGLRATVPVRSILEDLSGIAEPNTELGKLHHAWVRERGLPCGLDHHDHP